MLSPLGSIKYLFVTGIIEITWFYVHFGLILLAAVLSNKMQGNKKKVLSALIAFSSIIITSNFDTKSELLVSAMLSLFLVVQLYLLKLISFDINDYLILFAAFLIPRRLFNSSYTLWGYGPLFLIILSVLLGYGKILEKKLKGKLFSYYMSFVYLSLTAFIFQMISGYIYDIFRYRLHSAPLDLIAMEGILILLLWLTTFFLQHKLEKPFSQINRIGIRYTGIERYIIYLSCCTVIIFMTMHIPFILTRTSSDVLQAILSTYYIAILLIQILLIVLLYKITDYKENLVFLEKERENQTTYYTSLNNNLKSMENIRHDIKNIFLTMGNFVDKSESEEMKKFYQDKIYPFAAEEIEKNYLFSKLYEIPSETIRAFLHFKLFQAHNMNESIKLEVSIDKDTFDIGMDVIDLTRILGILLDNAFEECADKQDSYVDIRIRNNQSLISYTIKNTVTNPNSIDQSTENKSHKPGHSGLGLKIVNLIIKEYPLVSLNTYVDETFYIQSLNIRNEQISE
jgi:hypothetical protein